MAEGTSVHGPTTPQPVSATRRPSASPSSRWGWMISTLRVASVTSIVLATLIRCGPQAPASRDAPQPFLATLGEDESAADHEIADRARDEHLAGVGGAHHAGGDVDGHAADVVPDDL